MVSELKVKPLASESMGVRSMATYIEANDINIVIDPAVALAPNRFGLPPHPVEEEVKAALWNRIKEHVTKADVIVVTHYHYDHIDPKEPEIYAEKMALLKHPRRMINRSQMERAATLLPRLRELVDEIRYSDGQEFRFGDTEIRFSKPVPHGMTARRGYVIEVSVRSDETFLFTSDVQGPLLEEQVDFILEEEPDLVFVDGPTTYIDSPYMPVELREANDNLVKIVEETGISHLVIDHHLTRDLDYMQRIGRVYEAGEELGVTVECAAEFLKEKPNLLEARRRDLYQACEVG